MKDTLSKIVRIDKLYSEKIFNLRIKNVGFTKLTKLITRIYGIVPILLIALLRSKNILLTLIIFAVIIVINSLVVEDLIKNFVKRERPSFLEKKLSSYSFPSTHSSTITMATIHLVISSYLYTLSPIVLIIILAWGLFVLLSRIIYGHHHIIDVVAGVVVGSILYLPILFVLRT